MTIGYKRYNLKFKKDIPEIDREKLIKELFSPIDNYICKGCGAIIKGIKCDYCGNKY